MEFKKYMSLKRAYGVERDNMLKGQCFIFPKLDGTNASAWLDKETEIVQGGSRNRLLDTDCRESDNAGFCGWARVQENIKAFLLENPNLRLYGEWLVPHTIKTYIETAWRKFYIFDVYDEDTDTWMRYDEYQPLLKKHKLTYIEPFDVLYNPTEEQLQYIAERNTYLLPEGEIGEGIVVKNYDAMKESLNSVAWKKMVLAEFKIRNKVAFPNAGIHQKLAIEEKIVDEYMTCAFIEKEHSKFMLKLENEEKEWSRKCIPEILNRIMDEFIEEESLTFVKKLKYPTVDFRRVLKLGQDKIKATLPQILEG